jgi:Immunoglobulin-like domain of bacterial spore germination
MNKKIIVIVLIIVVLGLGLWYWSSRTPQEVKNVMSFQNCVDAGYPVMESYPRQCKTPDGRTYAEEVTPPITYVNTSVDYIVVDLPFPGAVTGKEFKVTGKARGFYFEASFPVEVLDKDGKRIFIGPAQAQGDWMTDSFVPFEITVKVPDTYIGSATLVLHKDNPSDMREYDASMSFPITIEY